MYLSYKKLTESEKPFILEIFEELILPKLDKIEIEGLEKKLFSYYDMVNIPEKFKKIY